MIVVAWLAALELAGAGAGTALERCRQLDRAFDSKNMPKPCQAAADETNAPVAERVEALRLLAIAHVLNGDEALGESTFVRMLVLSPTSSLPTDAGPQFRRAFIAARNWFDIEGVVTAAVNAPAAAPEGRVPLALQVDVADRLGRVAIARLRSRATGADVPLEVLMVKRDLAAGQVRFTGTVPEPKGPAAYSLDYEIVLIGWDGAAVPLASPLTGAIRRDAIATPPAADGPVDQGEVTVTSVDAAGPAPVSRGLLSILLGGIGVVGAITAVASGGLAVWADIEQVNVGYPGESPQLVDRQEFLARNARIDGSPSGMDPAGGAWLSGYGSAGGDAPTASAQLARRASAHEEMTADRASRTTSSGIAVGAGAAAIAAIVGAVLAWPEAPTEGGEPASAPAP